MIPGATPTREPPLRCRRGRGAPSARHAVAARQTVNRHRRRRPARGTRARTCGKPPARRQLGWRGPPDVKSGSCLPLPPAGMDGALQARRPSSVSLLTDADGICSRSPCSPGPASERPSPSSFSRVPVRDGIRPRGRTRQISQSPYSRAWSSRRAYSSQERRASTTSRSSSRTSRSASSPASPAGPPARGIRVLRAFSRQLSS